MRVPCLRCGRPIPDDYRRHTNQDDLCPACRGEPPPAEPQADLVHPGLFDGPDTPYAGTSGHAYTPTSERGERWRRGKQGAVHAVLARRGKQGATSPEIERTLNLGHGGVSGALSAMHKAGRVARLAETRGWRGTSHSVYVLPQHVDGRQTEPQGRRKT